MTRSRTQLTILCALALVCLAAFTGCGKVSNKPGETVREGLSTPLGGLRYTVFLTRMLNLRNEEDTGYLPTMKEAAPGRSLWAVFMEACNTSHSNVADASSTYYIMDSQGNRYDPVSLPRTNPYAFQGGPVPTQNCEPRRGSLAQLGPTSGAMLLFNLPNTAAENRPLTLHIENPTSSNPPEATVTLDF